MGIFIIDDEFMNFLKLNVDAAEENFTGACQGRRHRARVDAAASRRQYQGSLSLA